MAQLKTGKTYKEAKIKMHNEQGGLCSLCKQPLDSKAHLDHDHSMVGVNAGRVRGLLCAGCNRWEGKAKSWFSRLGLHGRGVNISEFLRELANYLEKDYSNNDFHPQYITDMISIFKRKSLQEMRDEMLERGYKFEITYKKSDLVKKFSKSFRAEQYSL